MDWPNAVALVAFFALIGWIVWLASKKDWSTTWPKTPTFDIPRIKCGPCGTEYPMGHWHQCQGRAPEKKEPRTK